MIPKQTGSAGHCITEESIASFVQYEAENGASETMIRRLKGTLRVVFDYLPDDKHVTGQRLLDWRNYMERCGYASATVLNYVKYLNRYLDYVGCSDLRFHRGRAKDLTGMTFGYLTAIEPTGRKDRSDLVWVFRCKCGNTVELPATRVLTGNTLSCGCLKGAHFRTARKIFDGTSIVTSMTEKTESTRSVSGYTGVTPKRDKWQAYIKYKGIHYSLGCYRDLHDAVKARARAKELVMADARGLLDFYTEIQRSLPALPSKKTEPKRRFACGERTVHNTPTSAAKRSDNNSGCVGVSMQNGRWEARICYKSIRYVLGRFDLLEEAVQSRKAAERDLRLCPEGFAERYNKYRHHSVKRDGDTA